ncbi:MAG: hypothetical protein MJ209_07950, partial [archaeon]|nr:hypothetical protein [archaeon]
MYFYDNVVYDSDGCNDVYNHNSAFAVLVNSYCDDIKNCYGMSKFNKDLLISGTELGTIVLSCGVGAVASCAGGVFIGTVVGSSVGIFGVIYVA